MSKGSDDTRSPDRAKRRASYDRINWCKHQFQEIVWALEETAIGTNPCMYWRCCKCGKKKHQPIQVENT